MSVQFRAYPNQDVAASLPQRKKEDIDSNVSKAKANLQEFNVNEGKVEKNWFPLIIALGVIVALGGIFLALAAHQILPHGVNAISNLGIAGQILGYGVIGLGTIAAVVGAVKSYLTHNQNSKINIYIDGVAAVQRNAEEGEMDSYFPNRLNQNELFIVDHASRSEIAIYFRERDEEDKIAYSRCEYVSYSTSSPKEAFQEWCGRHQAIVTGASCIDLQTLRDRTEAFERTHPIL